MTQQPIRKWHIIERGGWFRVLDPEQRERCKFSTREQAQAYMAAITARVRQTEPVAMEVMG